MLKPGHVPVVVFVAVNAHDAGTVSAHGVPKALASTPVLVLLNPDTAVAQVGEVRYNWQAVVVLHTNVAFAPATNGPPVNILNEKRPIFFVVPKGISGAVQVRLLYADVLPVVQVSNLVVVLKLAPNAGAGNTEGQLNGKSEPPT